MKIDYYFETGSTDPYYNLAFEEVVFETCREGDSLILWQNANTIVIGQNQITEQQINRPFVEAADVNVVRRMTGGGAVYHDLGNLNYSFITDLPKEGGTQSLFELAEPIVKALSELGLSAEVSGRNDITVEGRKVSGTAQRIHKGRILHHGTLLFDSDGEVVQKALRVDPEKFRGKGIPSVRSRIGNIREFLKEDLTIDAFWEYLKTALLGKGVQPLALTEEEQKRVDELAEKKYRTWEWNYGYSPRFEQSAKAYLPGGLLEAGLTVTEGRIEVIRFTGDFLSLRELTELQESLCGIPFTKKAVGDVLSRGPLSEYFGSIKEEEILDLLFSS